MLLAVPVVAATAVSGCSTPGSTPLPASEAVTSGVVVAVRTIPAADLHGDILRALGTGAPISATPVAEFVVSTASGRTVSVVQPDAGQIRPGDRVTMAGTPPRRLIADPAPR